jgi:hypothetical protein
VSTARFTAVISDRNVILFQKSLCSLVAEAYIPKLLGVAKDDPHIYTNSKCFAKITENSANLESPIPSEVQIDQEH